MEATERGDEFKLSAIHVQTIRKFPHIPFRKLSAQHGSSYCVPGNALLNAFTIT